MSCTKSTKATLSEEKVQSALDFISQKFHSGVGMQVEQWGMNGTEKHGSVRTSQQVIFDWTKGILNQAGIYQLIENEYGKVLKPDYHIYEKKESDAKDVDIQGGLEVKGILPNASFMIVDCGRLVPKRNSKKLPTYYVLSQFTKNCIKDIKAKNIRDLFKFPIEVEQLGWASTQELYNVEKLGNDKEQVSSAICDGVPIGEFKYRGDRLIDAQGRGPGIILETNNVIAHREKLHQNIFDLLDLEFV